jgi:hypothetical protein
MDQPPKAPTDSSILDELKRAFTGADRCIELARKERDRIHGSSLALSAGGMEAEHQVLEHARERREQLEALELRAELTPPLPLEGAVPTPIDQQPAAVPSLDPGAPNGREDTAGRELGSEGFYPEGALATA